MKITTLETNNKMGWRFKASVNNFDGGVLIYGFHPIFHNVQFKSFIDEDDAKLWVDMLVESTRILVEEVKDANSRTK